MRYILSISTLVHTGLPAILFLIHSPLLMKGQEVSFQIYTERNEYMIGEYVPVRLSASADRMLSLRWPTIQDTLPDGLPVLKVNPVNTVREADGMVQFRQTIIVSAYDSGHYTIQPILLSYEVHGSNEIRYATTGPVQLNFKLMTVEQESDIRDIKEPMSLPHTFLDFLPWILLALLLVAIVWILIRFLRKHRTAKPKTISSGNEEKPRQPWEVAIASLEKLRESSLLQEGMVKDFFVALTLIFRNYIRDGLSINAPEFTTRQTLKKLSSHKAIDRELHEKCRDILHLADLVKFAKSKPDDTKCLAMLHEAIDFVIRTTPEHVSTKPEEVEE